MKKIMKDGPRSEDLDKVKETRIRERETSMRENGFWLTLLKNHYLTGDRLMTLDEYKAVVGAVSAADIKAIADKYLNTKSYVEVDLTPAPGVKAK